MNVPFLNLKAAGDELGTALEAAATRVIQSGWFIKGAEVAAFESEFAAYCGAKHCVGVANGLDALELVLRAWDIGPGDEVIVPTNTFIATWLAVSLTGATLVPVEPDPVTHNMAPAGFEAAITPRTRAVIPVYLYGQVANMEAISAIARKHGVRVLADAAQAHGAHRHGRRAGALADAATFSFYPAKNLGALGDGGAVVTSDAATADAVRVLGNYGSAKKYAHDRAGMNSRLDELQAAFLRVKLPLLDAWNARRRAVAERYDVALAGLEGLTLPASEPETLSSWHLYVVRHRQRDALTELLADRGIATIIHYPTPAHLTGAYADQFSPGQFPVAERLAAEVLSLPIGPHMTDAEVNTVSETVQSAVAELR